MTAKELRAYAFRSGNYDGLAQTVNNKDTALSSDATLNDVYGAGNAPSVSWNDLNSQGQVEFNNRVSSGNYLDTNNLTAASLNSTARENATSEAKKTFSSLPEDEATAYAQEVFGASVSSASNFSELQNAVASDKAALSDGVSLSTIYNGNNTNVSWSDLNATSKQAALTEIQTNYNQMVDSGDFGGATEYSLATTGAFNPNDYTRAGSHSSGHIHLTLADSRCPCFKPPLLRRYSESAPIQVSANVVFSDSSPAKVLSPNATNNHSWWAFPVRGGASTYNRK